MPSRINPTVSPMLLATCKAARHACGSRSGAANPEALWRLLGSEPRELPPKSYFRCFRAQFRGVVAFLDKAAANGTSFRNRRPEARPNAGRPCEAAAPRPAVRTQVPPADMSQRRVEEVHIGKQQVTETERVSGEVRKEHADVDVNVPQGKARGEIGSGRKTDHTR